MRALIEQAFDQPPAKLVEQSSFAADKARVFDSLIATWIVPSTQRQARFTDLARVARLIDLIERSAKHHSTETPTVDVLARTLVLPNSVFSAPAGIRRRAASGHRSLRPKRIMQRSARRYRNN